MLTSIHSTLSFIYVSHRLHTESAVIYAHANPKCNANDSAILPNTNAFVIPMLTVSSADLLAHRNVLGLLRKHHP